MAKTITSREFNQDTAGAKRAAMEGPVFITDRGQPAHVLLNIDDYRRLCGMKKTMTELLSMPGVDEIDIEFPRSRELDPRFDSDRD